MKGSQQREVPPFKFADELMALAKDRITKVMAQREEILEAFVAKYGFDPDHVIQLERRSDDGRHAWHVIHYTEDQMKRVRDVYLMSLVSKKPLTNWQAFCLWLAGVRPKRHKK
jgi:hypothetical protein